MVTSAERARLVFLLSMRASSLRPRELAGHSRERAVYDSNWNSDTHHLSGDVRRRAQYWGLTVETVIKDSLKYGQPLYKGQCTSLCKLTSEIRTASLQGTMDMIPMCPLFRNSIMRFN